MTNANLMGVDAQDHYLNDTWVWNGCSWTERHPITSPGTLSHHSTTYDAERAQVILFGGWNPIWFTDTWAWNGTTWSKQFPATTPPWRIPSATAYDSARQEIVIFGSGQAVGTMNDTWVWRALAEQ